MLDYFGISYNIVEVNPVLRTQLKWSENYKKVPILIVETPEGNILQLNDSSMIISTLYSFLIAQNATGKNSTISSGTMDARGNNPILHIANCYPTVKYTVSKSKTHFQSTRASKLLHILTMSVLLILGSGVSRMTKGLSRRKL